VFDDYWLGVAKVDYFIFAKFREICENVEKQAVKLILSYKQVIILCQGK